MSTVAVYASWRCPDSTVRDLAAAVGRGLAEAGHTIVFGGGGSGPMGAVGRAALAAGGKVISVTQPEWVEDIDHDYAELVTAPDLTARMGEMERRADAFVVLPGGLGTAAEFFSAWADAGNGAHVKPIVLVDRGDDFEPLMTWAARQVNRGYAEVESLRLVQLVWDAGAAVQAVGAGLRPVERAVVGSVGD